VLDIIATLAAWASIVIIVEALWRTKILRGEYSRKAIHVPVNIVIAMMPFYMSWREIQITGALGVLAILLLRYTRIIKSLYDIKRFSLGEVLGALTVFLLTFFEPDKILFLAVVLHIGLADGLAAVIGTRFGKGNRYRIFGYTKSVAGSVAFYFISLFVTACIIQFGGIGTFAVLWPMLLWLPLATTIVENIGVYGADNALVALMTIIVFNNFV
jgi:phytol kinase